MAMRATSALSEVSMKTVGVRIGHVRLDSVRISSLCCLLAFSSAVLAQSPLRHPLHGGAYPAAPDAQTPAAAQTSQPSATGKPSAALPAATPATATQPASQLTEPPKQAVIETQANSLTIRADNASLTQTLQRLADKTGMQLEGISGDQRVFGNFGPGSPRDVLNTLLTGTGYNILMIGALDNGVPRELILSQKKSEGANAQRSMPQQQTSSADDDTSSDSPQDDPPPPIPQGGNGPQGIRTPQQMLQQMQQMRQAADQNQVQQPQQ